MGSKNKTIAVQVIFKAIDIINGNACHFITFEELSTNERVYLQVGIGNYMMIVEGDRGELHYKEHRKRHKHKFILFRRVVYDARHDSSLIEQMYEDEANTLDKEPTSILEVEKGPINHEKNHVDFAALKIEEPSFVEETDYDSDIAQHEK